MKIVEEKKMVEVVSKKYVAIDGKEFSNEEDCKKWEKSYEGTVTAMFENTINKIKVDATFLGIPYATEEWEAYVIELHSVDEVALVNAYLDFFDNYHEGKSLPLNTPLILMFGYDRDWVDVYDLHKETARLVAYHTEIEKKYKETFTKIVG